MYGFISVVRGNGGLVTPEELWGMAGALRPVVGLRRQATLAQVQAIAHECSSSLYDRLKGRL